MPEPLWFSQSVSLRLTEDGELFLEDGRPSLYAPGHGDLVDAIRRSGTLDELRRRGVEHVTISNVDNLGARLDPVVVGAHVVAGRSLTAEVAVKEGDMGGAPARVDGRLGLLEGPQFPPDFDHERIAGVQHEHRHRRARRARPRRSTCAGSTCAKTVDGRTAVQLERLYHQISWELDTTFLAVPRRGPRGRFFPIKEPEDLGARAGRRCAEMLAASVLD